MAIQHPHFKEYDWQAVRPGLMKLHLTSDTFPTFEDGDFIYTVYHCKTTVLHFVSNVENLVLSGSLYTLPAGAFQTYEAGLHLSPTAFIKAKLALYQWLNAARLNQAAVDGLFSRDDVVDPSWPHGLWQDITNHLDAQALHGSVHRPITQAGAPSGVTGLEDPIKNAMEFWANGYNTALGAWENPLSDEVVRRNAMPVVFMFTLMKWVTDKVVPLALAPGEWVDLYICDGADPATGFVHSELT